MSLQKKQVKFCMTELKARKPAAQPGTAAAIKVLEGMLGD